MTDEAAEEDVTQDGDDRPTPRERLADLLALVRTVAREAGDREVTFLGAAVAYYAFVSLVPLALLGVALGTLAGGTGLAGGISGAFDEFLTPAGEQVLGSALSADTGRGGATLLGVAVLLWGGLKLFRGLDRAFSQVYGSEPGSLPEQLVDAATVLAAVLLGVVAMVAVGAAVTVLPLPPLAEAAGVGAVWLTLVVGSLPLYYVFPDADVDLREALPGAALSATAFAALGTLFGVYAAVAGNYALYGLLGAVLLLLTWLYVAATAVMVGAVLNAVLSGRIGGWRTAGSQSGDEPATPGGRGE